jgi:hypothetical protein
MTVSKFEHISFVCRWHDEQPQAPPIGPDREWAKRWLLEQKQKGKQNNAAGQTNYPYSQLTIDNSELGINYGHHTAKSHRRYRS